MILVNGKEVSNKIKEEIAIEVEKLKEKGIKTPHLAAVLVGEDGASRTYVNAKVKACEKVGFDSSLVKLENDITEADLLAEIEKLNNNADIDGFIVQLPLPKHIDEQKINIPSGFLMALYLTLFVQIYLHLLIYLVTLL